MPNLRRDAVVYTGANVMKKDMVNRTRDMQYGYLAKSKGRATYKCPECGRTMIERKPGEKRKPHRYPRPNNFMNCPSPEAD